jgi:hypothetical protein
MRGPSVASTQWKLTQGKEHDDEVHGDPLR